MLRFKTDKTMEKQRAYLDMLVTEQAVGVVLATYDPDGPTSSALMLDQSGLFSSEMQGLGEQAQRLMDTE